MRPKASQNTPVEHGTSADKRGKKSLAKAVEKEEVLEVGSAVGKGEKEEKAKGVPEDATARARNEIVKLLQELRQELGFNNVDGADPLTTPPGFEFHHHLSETNLRRMLGALADYHDPKVKHPPPSGIAAAQICPYFVNTSGETIANNCDNISTAPLFEESGKGVAAVDTLQLEKRLQQELSESLKKQAHMATATLRDGIANEAEFKLFVSQVFTDFLYYAFYGFFKVQSEMPLPPVDGVLNYGRVEIGVAPEKGCPVLMTVELKRHIGGDSMPQLLGEIAACYGKNFAGLLAPSATFHILWEKWEVKVYRARYTSNGKFEVALIEKLECPPPWPLEEDELLNRRGSWVHFYKTLYIITWKAMAIGAEAVMVKSRLRAIAGDIGSEVSSASPRLPAHQKKQIIESFVGELARSQQRVEEFTKSQKMNRRGWRRFLKQISDLLQTAASNEEKLAQVGELVKNEQSEQMISSTTDSFSSVEEDPQPTPKRKLKSRSRLSLNHWESILSLSKSHYVSIVSSTKSGKEIRFRQDLKTIFVHLRECYSEGVVVPDWV